jgi:hypothetical protein
MSAVRKVFGLPEVMGPLSARSRQKMQQSIAD